MVFLQTFTTLIKEIISSPDFKVSPVSLQQQIKHLLFLAKIADIEDWEVVIEEHDMILEDIKNGVISWDNEEYFTQWQSKILQLMIFSSECEDKDDTDSEKDIEHSIENNLDKESLTAIEDEAKIYFSRFSQFTTK